MFQEAGWISASLGDTILRAETAAIASLAVVLAELRTLVGLARATRICHKISSTISDMLLPSGCCETHPGAASF